MTSSSKRKRNDNKNEDFYYKAPKKIEISQPYIINPICQPPIRLLSKLAGKTE